MRRLLKSDYTLSVISKVVIIFVGLLSSSFSTRFLGLQYKGDYAFINQAANVAVLILNFGLYQSYSYNYRKMGDVIYQKYISIFIFQFFVFDLIAVVLYYAFNNFLFSMILLLVPFQILRVQMDNIMLVQNIRLRIYTNMLSSILLMVCYFLLYSYFPSGILPVVLVTVAVDIIVCSTYFIKSRLFPKLSYLDFTFFKGILKFGFLPMLSALLVTLNYSVDIFFLKRMGIASELSMYSIAAGIMNYVWLIPDAFKDILFSRVARKDDNKSVSLSLKASLVVLVITTIGFVLLGRLFIRIMYGSDFLPAYGVTLVLFFGVYSMVFFKIFGIVFLAEGRRKPHFIILLVSVLINVVLNYLLIPQYGMYGAAIASVGSYNVCGLLFLWYFARAKHQSIRALLFLSKYDIETVKSAISRK